MRIGVFLPGSASDTVSWDVSRAFVERQSSGRRMTPQSPNEALQPEAPPPPPPKPPSKRRPTLSALSGFISFLVIAAVGALAALAWGNGRLLEPGPLPADKVVFIAQHTDVADIVDKLEAEGVIDSPLAFNVVLAMERKRGKVKAGEYLFRAQSSLRAVVDLLVSGKQILHGITIPEGLTSTQVVDRLRDTDVLVGEIRETPKDGTILPETYKVARGTTRFDLVQKMEDDDRRVVEQIWARRAPDLPLRSPYEMVTLASMVEKETGKADERSRVAGVFINRLQRRMRLQSDPTIVYGLVGGQGTLGHSITRAELDKKTPYNTYQVDGLPPGPIDNPGRAALEAVANPSRTTDLYFVADGTGGHAFASTIEEHNHNVQRWRQIQQDAKDKSDVDRLSPSAVAPPAHGNQRSDAADPMYGLLPAVIGTVSAGQIPAFTDPQANHEIDKVAAAEARIPLSPRGRHRGRGQDPAVPLDPASLTASIDTMGFSLAGSQPRASEVLDGPVSSDAMSGESGPDAAMVAATSVAKSTPVLPRGGKAALDALPSDHPVDLFAESAPAPASPVPTKLPPAHPKIYDASEGTPNDPLLEKDYDLNTAKTIPADLVR